MTTIPNSVQSFKGYFPRQRIAFLLGATSLVILLVGGWVGQRLWWPAMSTPTITGELVARQMAEMLQAAPGVQSAAGAYVPGDRLLLYSRLAETDRARVRLWALLQLEPFHKVLTPMAADEQLQWVIDFGPNGMEQEIILVPLDQVTDTATYRYVSSTPGLLTGSAPVATPPTALPAAPATDAQPAAAALPEPAAAVAIPHTVDTNSLAPRAASGNAFTFDDPAISAEHWSALAGEWVIENGVYSQRRTTGYDYISMLNLAPQSDYQLEAQLRLVTGEMGGGFIYNAPTRETRRGAQIIDFVEGGAFLRWGRYDDQGNYVYEGGVRVDPPINDGAWHTLQLLTHAATSTVTLDGRALGQITNSSTQGYLGLTTSQAQVDFKNVVVVAVTADGPIPTAADVGQPTATPTTVNPSASSEPVAGFTDDFATGSGNRWRVLNGVWQFVDQSYQQMSTVGLDLGSISTFQGESYTATVRLQWLSGSMGGGLYFNMAQRDNKMRSQVINYTNDGKALQWGYFDEGGNFVLEQRVDVPNGGDGAWHKLGVAVRQGQATFTLDDQVIAQAVPLTYRSGYVGLFVSNSQIAFDDFMIVTE